MHLLIVTHDARSGTGPGRNIVTTLAALLEHSNLRITLVAEHLDARFVEHPNPRLRWESDFHPKRPAAWARSLRTLQRAARGTDVLWVPANLGALLLAQTVRLGRPLLVGPNVAPLPYRRHDAPGPVEARLLWDTWFEASQARYRHVARHIGEDALLQIPHAVDTNQFSPTHRSATFWEERGLAGDGPVALFVGKDYPLKGLTPLLDALELVNAGRPTPVRFAAVGNLSAESRARIADLPWAIAPGFLSGHDLETAYASADFSTVPSSWEGFSFSLLEAQSSGIPSICGSRGGMPEIVADGETGLVVEVASDSTGLHLPEAPARLAEAIARLANDADLRTRMGKAARARVEDHFSLPCLSRNMLHAFQRLLGHTLTP